MIYKRFKSGRYVNQTYLNVWIANPDYMYWMASNFEGSYWSDVVHELEQYDKRLKPKENNSQYPSVETVRMVFKNHPICGFDMSDYICEIYELCPNNKKKNYYQSLIERNKIVLI